MSNNNVSVISGPPLDEEAGLGALTLPGFLREAVAKHADKELAVEWRGEKRHSWSYADLDNNAHQLARALLARGVSKGSRVGILMSNRLEFLSAVYGVALCGAVATTFSTFSTAAELDVMLENSGCSVLLLEQQILQKNFANMVVELEPEAAKAAPGKLQSLRYPHLRSIAVLDAEQNRGALEGWDSFLQCGDDFRADLVDNTAASVSPADPGVLFFSSGTTGKPKGILSSHRGVCLQMWRWAKWYAYGEGVRSWSANGFFWSGNFAIGIGASMASGGCLILQRTFAPEAALELMEKEKANFLFAWPHQWSQLTGASNWLDVDLSAMYYIDKNSPIAAHPTITTDYIEPACAYGTTETFTLATVYPANTPPEETVGSHGRLLAGNRMKIVDPLSGKPVAMGERGEIAIKGPTLMMGYIGQTAEQFLDEDGYFHTGDGGYVDDQGRLFWEGRLNDIIKTGGANVSPVEVDGVIAKCEGVKATKTVGVPDELLGELLVSCVVLHTGISLSEHDIRQHAKQTLASYKVPRRVLFVAEEELELTGSNKIKAQALIELAQKRFAAEAA